MEGGKNGGVLLRGKPGHIQEDQRHGIQWSWGCLGDPSERVGSRKKHKGWSLVGTKWVKEPRDSPAYSTLKVSLAVAAVGSLGLVVTAVTVTQSVELHCQLLREAKCSEPQELGLWEAVISLECNPEIHLRTGWAGTRLSHTCVHVCRHTPSLLIMQNSTPQ